MKIAVSIPDDVFREAERLAERRGWTRSELYARALVDFVTARQGDPVTVALDALADEVEPTPSPNVGRSLIDDGLWRW